MNPKLKKLFGRLAMIMTVGLIAATPALAGEYIDIEQSVGFYGLVNGSMEPEFVPNGFNITEVSVYPQYHAGTFAIQIRDAVCGTVLAHGSGAGGPGWVKCNLVGAQTLVPGQSYVINVASITQMKGANTDPYPNGELWFNCNSPLSGVDLVFRTWTDEEAVPTAETTWGSVKSLFR